ncbi:organic cation/carnitine transporter 2-like isoform X2 [Odontesthes bonariensis]|uniref:organic cation/carnitine transporter 2-like isoform X2 n=1 Tax=Odontesthes bonariensis TaxID=219752 RepID=UPI003F58C633
MCAEPSATNKIPDYEAETAFLGEWGRFQQRVFFLLCLSVIPNGFSGLSVVFLADTPPHRCLVPAHLNLTAAWRNSSIPLERDESRAGALMPSRCSRFKLEEVVSFSERGLLPGIEVNLSNVPREGCLDGWEYDQSIYTSTIITEIWEKNSDVCHNSSPDSRHICSSFLSELDSILCCVFCYRVGSHFQLCGCICLRHRDIRPKGSDNFLHCGSVSVLRCGLHASATACFPHQRLEDASSQPHAARLPLFASLVVGGFIPESPRWLLSQGRVKEAEAIFRNAAKLNKIEPPPVIFSSLQKDTKSEKRRPYNICDLLRSRNIRWISITLWLVWNTLTIAYFALSLNTANLHGNPFFNCFLSALVEFPAYTLSWVMFRWCSRRLSLSSTLFTGGLFLLIVQLIPAHLVYVAITLEMMGKFAVTTAFAVVYAYSAEIYPTVLRNTAVGTCSMASRIGSIIAPFFIYLRSYSISLPYILMGTLTTLAGLLSLLLPESFGMPLPDTITHMQHFPGCCRKTPYTLTHTVEEENTTEGKPQHSNLTCK